MKLPIFQKQKGSRALQRSLRVVAGALTFALVTPIVLASTTTSAHAQVDRTVQDPWQDAKEYYRRADYAEAARYIVEAAQRDPNEPRYIISLARAYFQLGDYDRAVHFYDLYLQLGADRAAEFRAFDERYSRERAQQERDAADDQRAAPATDVPTPPFFRELRAAVETQIERGPILTDAGGGAVAAWEALLRTGYVSPSLADVRRELADALVREAEAELASDESLLPVLTLDAWRTLARRFTLANTLLPRAIPFDESRQDAERTTEDTDARADTALETNARLRAWVSFCEGQIQYLNQNYISATRLFDAARGELRDQPLAVIGALNTRIAARDADHQTSELLTDLNALRGEQVGDPVISMYRVLLAAPERPNEAATVLADFFLSAQEPPQ